jgi:hypothetical protein
MKRDQRIVHAGDPAVNAVTRGLFKHVRSRADAPDTKFDGVRGPLNRRSVEWAQPAAALNT